MAHGYYNLKGEFVKTATLEAATAAWREERGYEPLGVFDMGGGKVVDTRKETVAPTTTQTAAANLAQTLAPTTYNVQGIHSLAATLARSAEVTARAGVSPTPAPAQTASTGFVRRPVEPVA